MLYELPEPSGDITFADVKNSLGGRGVWRVGVNEFEMPDDDVGFYAQQLADALAVQRFRRDSWGRAAREAFLTGSSSAGMGGHCRGDAGIVASVPPAPAWEDIAEEARESWRRVGASVAALVTDYATTT